MGEGYVIGRVVPSRSEQLKLDNDMLAYGVSFQKDGKHIDLNDVYLDPVEQYKAKLIERLEGQKYTEDQGMDNEMENHNDGIQTAIDKLKED